MTTSTSPSRRKRRVSRCRPRSRRTSVRSLAHRLPGRPSSLLGDDVALHLAGAAADGEGPGRTGSPTCHSPWWPAPGRRRRARAAADVVGHGPSAATMASGPTRPATSSMRRWPCSSARSLRSDASGSRLPARRRPPACCTRWPSRSEDDRLGVQRGRLAGAGAGRSRPRGGPASQHLGRRSGPCPTGSPPEDSDTRSLPSVTWARRQPSPRPADARVDRQCARRRGTPR